MPEPKPLKISALARESGVPIEYSLFSQMNTAGTFKTAAKFNPS